MKKWPILDLWALIARKCGRGGGGGGGAGVGPGDVKSGEMSLNFLFYWSSIHTNTVCAHIGA